MGIWAKSWKIFAKSLKISGQKWHPTWFEKNGAQRLQNHMKTFFFLDVIPKERLLGKMFSKTVVPKFVWASLGKFGQKSFAPLKFACPCTYASDHTFIYLSPGTICFGNVLFSTSFL